MAFETHRPATSHNQKQQLAQYPPVPLVPLVSTAVGQGHSQPIGEYAVVRYPSGANDALNAPCAPSTPGTPSTPARARQRQETVKNHVEVLGRQDEEGEDGGGRPQLANHVGQPSQLHLVERSRSSNSPLGMMATLFLQGPVWVPSLPPLKGLSLYELEGAVSVGLRNGKEGPQHGKTLSKPARSLFSLGLWIQGQG